MPTLSNVITQDRPHRENTAHFFQNNHPLEKIPDIEQYSELRDRARILQNENRELRERLDTLLNRWNELEASRVG